MARPRRRSRREMPLQQPLQIADREIGGVDHQIGARRADGASSSALLADAVGDRPVEGQRMAPARLGEAPLQHLVVAVEEEQADARAPARRFSRCDALQQGLGAEVAGAGVDADGDGPRRSSPPASVEQSQRQIVDRLVAEILEGLERGAMPGARQAGHQHDAERRAGCRFAQGFRRRGGRGRRRGCRCLAHGGAHYSPGPDLGHGKAATCAAAEASNGSRASRGRAMPR